MPFPLIPVIIGVIALFGFSGAANFFWFQDKTWMIIIGFFVLLFLLRSRRG